MNRARQARAWSVIRPRLLRGWQGLLLALLVLTCLASQGWAKPMSAKDAEAVVAGWLSLEASPLEKTLGTRVEKVSSFPDLEGQSSYYVVKVAPQGLVFVPADDEVEPIIGFSAGEQFDPSDTNPLGALVIADIPGRVKQVREAAAKNLPQDKPAVEAQRKWETLRNAGTRNVLLEYNLSSISDVRVSPLVQSKWNQSTVGGTNTYNIYTPNNYVCGCVATAMSQLMRYHSFPTVGVGTTTFNISVCGTGSTQALRGGNGAGGAYSWSSMVLIPDSSTTTTQRQAISALTADAGASVNMDYCSSGSGTDTLKAATAFKSVFKYTNAVKGYNSGSNLPETERNHMVNANLDASHPVLFGITGSLGGHAIVCDGYGYNTSTMYHHLNMGWSGSDDLWYNLPTIGTYFSSVYKCVYNVFTSGTGEIMSGRVVDSQGNPISGASVTAQRSGGSSYSTTTNTKGIFAFSKIPAASTYTVSVTKSGYTFVSQSVSLGTSTDSTTTTGNKWGLQFTGSSGGTDGYLTVTLSPADAVTAGARWAVDGGSWQTSGTTLALAPGSHSVTFNSVTGYTSPATQSVTINTGQTIQKTGFYTLQQGSLTVTLSPAAAVTAGARWAVDGGSWQTSGTTVTGLSTGNHQVTFNSVTGYTSPATQTASIQAGETTSLVGVYQSSSSAGAYSVNDKVTYNWVDDTGGTVLAQDVDDSSYFVPLGFTFNFYGQDYTTVEVGSNGGASFLGQYTYLSNQEIPYSGTPNALVAPYWDDLVFSSSAGSRITYKQVGTSPNAKGVITWVNARRYGVTEASYATFQVILEQATGRILMQYKAVDFGSTTYDKGASATVGIEDETGTHGVQYSYNTPSLANNKAIAFTPGGAGSAGTAVPAANLLLLR